jgi:hypothetical protein
MLPPPIAPRLREFMDLPRESIPGEDIMGTATTPARPPFPPFTRESAMQKVRLAEDAWNTRDPAKVAPALRSIHAGGTDRSSLTDETKSLLSFLASGPRSWTTGSSRNYGRLPGTGSRYGSLTSGTTTRITGIAPTAMKTGNSVMMGSWLHGLHQSTTFPFWNQSANITGCSVVVPMTTQG